jgi:hypothetical protein
MIESATERDLPEMHIARDQVPPSVRESVEFQPACPASANVMRRQLR